MSAKQKVSAVVIIAVIAAFMGYLFSGELRHQADLKADSISGTLFSPARAVQPFTLTNDEGKPFTLTQLKGQWSLLFFGFTHCPHICPTTLAQLNRTTTFLKDAGMSSLPQVVLISVDPERDTPARLHKYIKAFNADFVGATGEKAQIDALAKQMAVLYTKVIPGNGNVEMYDIEHSGAVMLINPAGQLRALFTMPHDAKSLSKDILAIEQAA